VHGGGEGIYLLKRAVKKRHIQQKEGDTLFDAVFGSCSYIHALFSCAAHTENGKTKFLRNVCN